MEGAAKRAKPLADNYFYKSLSDGVLPLDWGSANITPVFKKGSTSKHLICNYQQISLICIIANYIKSWSSSSSKNIVHNTFHQVLSDTQFGFHVKNSTISSPLSILLMTGHLISTDDLLPIVSSLTSPIHLPPMSTIEIGIGDFGIHGSILQWFSSFLTTKQ